ncbi:MAG: hypothetical protein GX361_08465 [Bacteroidales bacterium]|nr:hypothetical protein [Bacteroidales bacterium]
MKKRALLYFLIFTFSVFTNAQKSNISWIDARKLCVEGMGWSEGIEDFTRLPGKYKSIVRDEIWDLSRNSTGITIHFKVSGTKRIKAKWTLRMNRKDRPMHHMTEIGISGLDLYVKKNDKWVWMAVGKPTSPYKKQAFSLISNLNASESYELMLYLPLYNGVSKMMIGVDKGASLIVPPASKKKPLVFYGTSIVQGCSASRPGMVFTSMLSREFDIPVINFGFSANGRIEEYFADVMGDIEAKAYFIDCLPNMKSFEENDVKERTLILVRKLKSLQPKTPIILVENAPRWSYFYYDVNQKIFISLRKGLKGAYNELKKEFSDIQYIEGNQLFANSESTVDGVHPTDLGMYYYYETLKRITENLLQRQHYKP